jgi:hypothetical protein
MLRSMEVGGRRVMESHDGKAFPLKSSGLVGLRAVDDQDFTGAVKPARSVRHAETAATEVAKQNNQGGAVVVTIRVPLGDRVTVDLQGSPSEGDTTRR